MLDLTILPIVTNVLQTSALLNCFRKLTVGPTCASVYLASQGSTVRRILMTVPVGRVLTKASVLMRSTGTGVPA